MSDEIVCSKCSTRHHGDHLPPSLKGRTTLCRKHYKESKKKANDAWNKEHKVKRKLAMQKWRKEHPTETRQSWKDRTARWKAKAASRKAGAALAWLRRQPKD